MKEFLSILKITLMLVMGCAFTIGGCVYILSSLSDCTQITFLILALVIVAVGLALLIVAIKQFVDRMYE